MSPTLRVRARLSVLAAALVAAGPVAAAAQTTTTAPPTSSTTSAPPTTAPPTTAPRGPVPSTTVPAATSATSIPAPVEDPPPPIPQSEWPDVIIPPRPPGLGAEVDALLATDAEIRARMGDLTRQLDSRTAALAKSKKQATAATAAWKKADAKAEDAREEAERTKEELKDMAVEAYLHPPSEAMASVVVSSSIEEALQRQSFLAMRAEQRADLLDARRDALAELEEQEEEAAAAKKKADGILAERKAAVSELEEAKAQQASFADAIENRLEASLAESAALASLDADLAMQLGAQQLALHREAGAAGLGGGSAGIVNRSGGVQVTKVGPFWVNVAIALPVQAMLEDFASTGHTLGGGAYRDPASQIRLRAAHCGPTPFDIYAKPSSSCSPPTARPGRSMHELGLALDIECDGKLIGSRNNFCFLWLAVNAANYGLYNLPSEPWHWSVNGN